MESQANTGSEAPRIVRRAEAAQHPLHGDGAIFRLIYPQTVGSRNLFVGVAHVAPGTAPHVFHEHSVERIGRIELAYAPHFEEFYFVVSGGGSMQWRDPEGTVRESPVEAGDAVYLPPGAMAHRIFNDRDIELTVLYGGTPPATTRETGAEE